MQTLAYCGAPPVPGGVSWNLDPVLITFLVGVACLYAAAALGRSVPYRQQMVFQSGWLIISLALVSPLCNLSVALFSARIGQHMLLEFVAAPLIATGLPGRVRGGPLRVAVFGALTFAAALWFWHLPGPYQWTFRSEAAYWLMHVSLMLSALLLWKVMLDSTRPAASLLASGITMAQMSILGAVYTFAGRAFFPVHFGTTAVWGFSPLEDQQLGGLIMWIPPGIALSYVAMWTLAALLAPQAHIKTSQEGL